MEEFASVSYALQLLLNVCDLCMLHRYEAVVANLTVRALQKTGSDSYASVIHRMKEAHKEVRVEYSHPTPYSN